MSNLVRKVQLIPVGNKEEVDRVYKYIREGMKAQNLAMNQYMSALYIAQIKNASKDDKKELNLLYSRISTSNKGSAYKEDIQFATGLATTALISQKIKKDFEKSKKDGLMYGKVSLPTYRDDNPLMVDVRFVALRGTKQADTGLYHEYETHMEFLDNLYSSNLKIYIKFANNITFQVVFGNPHKSAALRNEFKMIFEEYYKVCQSSIQIDDKKIMLNMTIDVPDKEIELDENICVGVDLGLEIPAMCSLNANNYIKKRIGNKDDFLRIRTKIQVQRKRLQSNLKLANGGHGRKKKLRALDRFKDYESHWVQNYNHFVSKSVVEFAVKNKAKYINLEDLSGFEKNEKNKFILRNWSYYQLQQYITYKAKAYGIEVRKINPCFTSQVCSCCGHWEEGQRIDQSHFVCKSCGVEMNADFNASRNISKSTLFTKKGEKIKDMIISAKEYYNIPLSEEDIKYKEEKRKRKTKKIKE